MFLLGTELQYALIVCWLVGGEQLVVNGNGRLGSTLSSNAISEHSVPNTEQRQVDSAEVLSLSFLGYYFFVIYVVTFICSYES